MIGVLKTLTAIKFASIIASIVVTVVAFLLWLYGALAGDLS